MTRHIVVSDATYEKLESMKQPTDTFEDIIVRLISNRPVLEFPEWFEAEIKQIREYMSNLSRLANKT